MNSIEKKHSHHQFITAGSSLSRPKYTTRHLAALDFLLNIPMSNEIIIRQNGIINAKRMKALEDNEGGQRNDDDDFETNELNRITGIQGHDDFLASQGDLAGKKLKGPTALTVRIPMQFRYFMLRISDQSVVVRQWEDQLLLKGNIQTNGNSSSALTSNQPLLSSRMFASRARCYPTMVFSVIKYDAGEEKAKIEKIRADDQKGLEVFKLPGRDWRGFSYKPLFKPLAMLTEEQTSSRGLNVNSSAVSNVALSLVSSVPDVISSYYLEKGYLFDPDCLDDPNMLHGSHRYVLQRSAPTGPIISSIILYVNEHELKVSLNEQFRERHPQLPPSLTLSRIRTLKKTILVFCLSVGIELSTVAIAVINFERLCLKNLVTKANRKLSMAVALVLAVKFNENEQSEHYRKRFEALLTFLDREWDLSKKEVFEAEFGAYVHLGFTLHIPHHHVYLVYTRLLKLVNKSSKSYLGETMNQLYIQDVLDLERAREQLLSALEEVESADAAEDAEGGEKISDTNAPITDSTLAEQPTNNAESDQIVSSSASVVDASTSSAGGFLSLLAPGGVGSTKSPFGILNFFEKDKDDQGRKRSSTVTNNNNNNPPSPHNKQTSETRNGREKNVNSINIPHSNSNHSLVAADEPQNFTRSETAPALSSSGKSKSFYSSAGLKSVFGRNSILQMSNPFTGATRSTTVQSSSGIAAVGSDDFSVVRSDSNVSIATLLDEPLESSVEEQMSDIAVDSAQDAQGTRDASDETIQLSRFQTV